MNEDDRVRVNSFRDYARERLLAELHLLGFATRSELMERLGLSRTMLTRFLESSFEDGLIEEFDDARPVARSAGRPARLLRLQARPRNTLALRLRSTELDIAVVAERGEVLGRSVLALGLAAPAEVVLEAAVEHAERFASVMSLAPERCVLVLPTMIAGDQRSIVTEHAQVLMPTWVDQSLVERLEGRLGLPILLGNDGQLGALAESRIGAGRGARTMLYVALGANGIGGGIVIDGRLHRGLGAAGEISHIPARADGAPCPCGQRGCFAAEIAALARRYRDDREHDGGRSDSDAASEESVDPATIHTDAPDAVGLDDPGRLAEFCAEALPIIARALATVANVLDPDKIVVVDALSEGTIADEWGNGIAASAILTALPVHFDAEVHPALRGTVELAAGACGLDAPLRAAGLLERASVPARFDRRTADGVDP